MTTIERNVSLQDADLERLDRRLTLASSKLAAPIERGMLESASAPGEAPAWSGGEALDLAAIKRDIVETTRTGVRIATQAESRPLIPLLLATGTALPPEIKIDHETMKYDFYLVEVTFSSLLPTDQYLTSAHLALAINDDIADGPRRTRPIRLFPGRKDIDLFKVDVAGGVSLDAGLNFTVPAGKAGLLSWQDLKADANVKAGVAVGPLSFQIRNAAIEVVGENDREVQWRYNLKSELRGTNDFKSVLVLKIAREATQVALDVSLSVVPCRRQWLVFRDVLPRPADQRRLAVELVRS